ncbi:TonB-dependent receptor [Rhodohalobacter sp. SW132]|uniref:SusC/RagA family TonB-linked outer membrane protein n=1 Tax=Rhodohalobacter sp. SW132 TaxID=2293433 RepID=UPI001315A802|nr:TonB-dependent receptor [Rhodohalobacter sp. SW132]
METKIQTMMLVFALLITGVVTITNSSAFASTHTIDEGEVKISELYGSALSSPYEVNQTITGTVTDARTGEPIPGANIYIQQLQTGSATNLDGNFEIQINEPGDYTLIATYVGYERYETVFSISGDETLTLDIELSQVGVLGDDLVVVGYGVQRRSDMTGSVSSISASRINETSITSLESGMQGRSAGVYVTQGGNKPNSGASIRIRGNRSITAGNDPLFVVDGVPISGGIADINPRDIESIEVLKDASATAIYGARGSNGVIIVTTQRGYDGDISVTYDGSVGFSEKTRRVNMMNGEEWAELRREAFRAAGNPTPDNELFHSTELEQLQNGTWTDYQDMITRRGVRQQHQLGIAGGSENARYYVSFGGLDHSGILEPEHFQRYNTRLNIDLDITDRIRIGTSTLGVYSIQEGGTRNFYNEAIQNTPLTQPYDENGELRLEPKPDAQRTNPLLETLPETYDDEITTQRILSNIYLEYLPTENLNFRVNFSPDLRTVKNDQFQAVRSRARQGGPAAAQVSSFDTFEYTWENIVNYQQTLGQSHSIGLTGLFSLQEFQREDSGVQVRGVPLTDMRYHNLGASEEILGASSDFQKWSLISYMARANYNYDSRYLLTLTGRIDGSSRFGVENQYGFFPSVALAWNVSNESFFSPTTLLNDLRVRLSWGKAGQTGINPYRTQGLASRTAFNFGGTPAFGFKPNQIRNDELKWETTTSLNLGVQWEMFDSRVVAEVDAYRQNTEDLLLERAIPTTSGFNSVLENVGATQNTGFEASLTTINVASGDFGGFQWTTNFNFAYNKEEIVELFGGAEDDVGNQWFIGHPINVYYNYEKIGIWQQNEASEAAGYGQRPGEIKVRDVTGSGSITGDDRVILGQEQPKWQGGLGNQFSYRNFDLSVFLVGRFGNMINSGIHTGGSSPMTGRYNNLRVDYWTPDNPTNEAPQPRADLETPIWETTRAYFSGDFVRVRNIGLAYNLPANIAQSVLGLQSLRFTVNAENPYIFAPYVRNHGGVDPETSTGSNTPSQWTLQFGINLTL